jgi:16S rRNA (guanine(966)-N(2))-methyltransferase RsmD
MRVIAGTARGHQLKAPKRRATRPATDLVRGAIFSMLETAASDWSRVLDLFSGSGALGIEALSRGAGWVDFIDHEPKCCAIIKQNLEKTKLADLAHVYCCSVSKALTFLDKEYSIILMDPPYSDTSIGNVINRLAASDLAGNETTVIITHSPHFSLESHYGALSLLRERRHGDSCIAVYRREA